MLSIKNWDNKTWISSTKYIKSFNKFLLKQKKLNKESKIFECLVNFFCFTKKLLKDLIYFVDEIQVLLSQFLILNIS